VVGSLLEEEEEAEEREGSVISDEEIGQEGKGRERERCGKGKEGRRKREKRKKKSSFHSDSNVVPSGNLTLDLFQVSRDDSRDLSSLGSDALVGHGERVSLRRKERRNKKSARGERRVASS